jgi:hypothetical protein
MSRDPKGEKRPADVIAIISSMPERIDHDLLDKFLTFVLDGYKAGLKTKDDAMADLAHLVTALDKGPGLGDDPNAYMKAILDHID